MKNPWILMIGLLLLASCKNETEVPYPVTQFQGKFVPRSVSLRMLLDDEFTLKDLTTGEKNTYRVEFDRHYRYNIVTEVSSGDTIFLGKAAQGNNIWLMQTELNDSSFFISGLTIRDNYLIGFNQVNAQMLKIDELVKKGILNQFENVGTDQKPMIIVDRFAIQPFLEGILDQLEPRYEIVQLGAIQEDPRSTHHMGGFIETASYSKADGFYLELKDPGVYQIEITTNSGHKQTISTHGSKFLEAPLQNIGGDYLKIRVIDPENKTVLDEMKLDIGE